MRIEGSKANLGEDNISSLFDRMLGVAKETPRDRDAPAYRMAGSKETWPEVRDVTLVEVPQAAKDKDGATGKSLAFKTADGEITVVNPEDNAGLFAFIESISKLSADARRHLGLDNPSALNGKILRNNETIKLADIQNLSELTSNGEPVLITATLTDGSKHDITRELTPGVFDWLAARYESQTKGFKVEVQEGGITDDSLRRGVYGDVDEKNGLIEIELPNGDKKQISAQATPELYKDALQAQKDKSEKHDDNPAYRMAGNNEVWPPVLDIHIVDVPQDAKDNKGATGESLAYTTGDKSEITVVRREDNPGLFDYVDSVSAIEDNTRFGLEAASDTKILRGDETIKLGDVRSFAELLSDGQPTVITAFMKDGTKVDITRELTPDMFDTAAARYDSQAKGFQLVTDESGISKDDLGSATIWPADNTNGMIELELASGEKRQISADTTPKLFGAAGGKYDEFTEATRSTAVDDARKEAGLAPATELNIGGLKTSEKDDKGNPLSVNDLAWKDTIAKWKDGIDKGEIKSDDERAKLYRTLQAQAIAEDGTNMAVLDISSGWNVQQALGKDYENILDKDKLEAAVPDLLSSKAVSDDILAARKEALGKVDGGDATFQKLDEMASSAEYMTYLKALKDDGKGQVAEDDIAATYEALVSIDPAKADQFAQNAQMDSLTMELNDLVGDTSKINDENLTLATQDFGKMLLTLMKKAGLDVGRRLAECEKFIQEMIGDKKTAKEFGKAMQELGAIYSDTGKVTQKDLDTLLGSGKYTALAEMPDGSALKTFSVLTKEGIIGSLGGTISLVSGIYQVASKGGKIGDTTEERLSVAKDFVGFIGAGKHFADLANDIIGKENKDIIKFNEKIDADNPTMSEEDRNKLKKDAKKPLLGLGGTLDDLVRKPSGTMGGGMTFTDEIAKQFDVHLDDVITGTKKEEFYLKRFGEIGLDKSDVAAVTKGLEKGFVTRPGVDAPTWQKGISGGLLILSAGADTFTGVADAVIGGLTIKKGIDSGDNNAIAKGALQLASGTFGTAGGLASFAGLSKGLGFLKALAGPAFVISAILTIVTLIPDIINDIKNSDKITGYQKDMLELFTQLDKDGMLQGDGLKAYQFLNVYMEQYGQRDAPEDQGIIAFRKEEYDFWVKEGHLPEAGFDDIEHKDYEGDGANLDTQMESSRYG